MRRRSILAGLLLLGCGGDVRLGLGSFLASASGGGFGGGGTPAPVFVSAEANFDGDRITLTYDAALLDTAVNWELPSSFTLAGTDATIYNVGKPDGATVELRLLGHIVQGETPTLSYTPSSPTAYSGPLAGSGGDVASFSTESIDVSALDTTTLTSVTGTVLVLHADHVTVNGSGYVTAVADQSGDGNDGTVPTPGTGLTISTIEGRDWLVFNQTQYLQFSDAALTGLIDGANGPVTVLASIQNLNTAQQYVCAWGANTSNSNALRMEFASSRNLSVVKRITSTTSAPGTDNDLNFDAQVAVWRAGSTGLVRQQGSDDGAGSIALPSGSYSGTYFSVGALVAGTSPTVTANARFRLRCLIVIQGVKSNAEIQALERLLARDAGIQHAGVGLTAHQSLLFPWHGQSNSEGRGTSNYTRTMPGLLRYNHSGHYDEAAEPFSDTTGDVYVPSVAPHVANGGWSVRYGDLIQTWLRSQGLDYDVILLQCAIGGTDSATWVTSLTTTPRPVGALPAIMQLRMAHVLGRGNCQIGCLFNWQIEQNAQNDTEADAIATDWQAFYDQLDSEFDDDFLSDTKRFVAVKGQSSAPNGGTGYGSWARARTAWDTLAAAESKLALVTPNNAGPYTDGTNLHFDTGADDTEGLRYVAAQAATVFTGTIWGS